MQAGDQDVQLGDCPIIYVKTAVKVNHIGLKPHQDPDARPILPQLSLLFDATDEAKVGNPHAEEVTRAMIGDGHLLQAAGFRGQNHIGHRPPTMTVAGVGMIISPQAQRQPYSLISKYNRLG